MDPTGRDAPCGHAGPLRGLVAPAAGARPRRSARIESQPPSCDALPFATVPSRHIEDVVNPTNDVFHPMSDHECPLCDVTCRDRAEVYTHLMTGHRKSAISSALLDATASAEPEMEETLAE